MPPSTRRTAAFSLVEVTLALGVAAICLIVLMGLLPYGVKTQQSGIQQTTANQIISQISSFLRADVRLPPGQTSKACPDPPDPNDPCDWSNLTRPLAERSRARHDVFHERRSKLANQPVRRQTRSLGQRSRTRRHQRKPLHWQTSVLPGPRQQILITAACRQDRSPPYSPLIDDCQTHSLPSPRDVTRGGFTLVELLVSIVVLVIVIFMVSQLMTQYHGYYTNWQQTYRYRYSGQSCI